MQSYDQDQSAPPTQKGPVAAVFDYLPNYLVYRF